MSKTFFNLIESVSNATTRPKLIYRTINIIKHYRLHAKRFFESHESHSSPTVECTMPADCCKLEAQVASMVLTYERMTISALLDSPQELKCSYAFGNVTYCLQKWRTLKLN